MSKFWTSDRLSKAIEILESSRTYEAALNEMSRVFKTKITKDAINHALKSGRKHAPSVYLSESMADSKEEPKAKASVLDPEIATLISAVKKKGCTLRYLCDEVFESSPKHVENLVAKARKLGYTIDIFDGTLEFRAAEPHLGIRRAPVTRKAERNYAIGVISDIHFGSKYCLPEAVIEHVEHCYNLGIRDIFCPGDLLEGCYRHARFELSTVGWEDQASEALSYLPQKDGLRYHFIDGNHDFTFTETIGMESGRALVRKAVEAGRNDLFFYGSRGARIDYDGTIIELWHPKKGLGYSKSYQLQNHIRDTHPKYMPHMVLAGHWHQYISFEQGGVFAVACGTFQHGMSPFGKSLGGDTAVGGVVIRWKMAEDGTVSAFSAEHRPVPVADPHFVVARTAQEDDYWDDDLNP